MSVCLVAVLVWLALWVLVAGILVAGEYVTMPRWATRLWDVIRRRPDPKPVESERVEVCRIDPADYVIPDGKGGLILGRIISRRNGIPHIEWSQVDPEDLTDDDPPT